MQPFLFHIKIYDFQALILKLIYSQDFIYFQILYTIKESFFFEACLLDHKLVVIVYCVRNVWGMFQANTALSFICFSLKPEINHISGSDDYVWKNL